MTTVTEGLVDAKHQARQAESRTDLAPAMLSLEQRIDQVGFASSRLAFLEVGGVRRVVWD